MKFYLFEFISVFLFMLLFYVSSNNNNNNNSVLAQYKRAPLPAATCKEGDCDNCCRVYSGIGNCGCGRWHNPKTLSCEGCIDEYACGGWSKKFCGGEENKGRICWNRGDKGTCCHEVNNICLGQPCPQGQYNKYAPATKCLYCGPGTYNSKLGQSACVLCPYATFCNRDGCTKCDSCAPGTHASNRGSKICSSCGNGEYSSDSKWIDCQKCSKGTYCNLTRCTSCFGTPAGFYSEEGAANPTPCSVRTYNPIEKATSISSCLSTPPGHFSAVAAKTATPCPKNTFAKTAGASIADCFPCAKYKYSTPGSSSCVTRTVTLSLSRSLATFTVSDPATPTREETGTLTHSASISNSTSQTRTVTPPPTPTRSKSVSKPSDSRSSGNTHTILFSDSVPLTVSVSKTDTLTLPLPPIIRAELSVPVAAQTSLTMTSMITPVSPMYANSGNKIASLKAISTCGTRDENGDLLPPPAVGTDQNLFSLSIGSNVDKLNLNSYRGAIISSIIVLGIVFVLHLLVVLIRMKYSQIDFWCAIEKTRFPGFVGIILQIVSAPMSISFSVLLAFPTGFGIDAFLISVSIIFGLVLPIFWFGYILIKGKYIDKLESIPVDREVEEAEEELQKKKAHQKKMKKKNHTEQEKEEEPSQENGGMCDANVNPLLVLWNFISAPLANWPRSTFTRRHFAVVDSYSSLVAFFGEQVILSIISIANGIAYSCETMQCCHILLTAATAAAIVHSVGLIWLHLPFTTRTEKVVNSMVSVFTSIIAASTLLQFLAEGMLSQSSIDSLMSASFYCCLIAQSVAVLYSLLLPFIFAAQKFLRKRQLRLLNEQQQQQHDAEELQALHEAGGRNEHSSSQPFLDSDDDDELHEIVSPAAASSSSSSSSLTRKSPSNNNSKNSSGSSKYKRTNDSSNKSTSSFPSRDTIPHRKDTKPVTMETIQQREQDRIHAGARKRLSQLQSMMKKFGDEDGSNNSGGADENLVSLQRVLSDKLSSTTSASSPTTPSNSSNSNSKTKTNKNHNNNNNSNNNNDASLVEGSFHRKFNKH